MDEVYSPLISVSPNQAYTIARVGSDFGNKSQESNDSTRTRLFEMGILPDEKITIIYSSFGLYVIRVGTSRYAIDKTVARNIFVHNGHPKPDNHPSQELSDMLPE